MNQSTHSISNYFSLIRQSLNGEEKDYTTGSIRRAVILLAIPMILEMCMESVFAIVDIYFVSHLGKHATSTVGLTESVITIVYSIAIGISMAATAMVARRIGEKNPEAAAQAGMQAIIVALAVTVFISVLGVIFSEEILKLMGAEPESIQMGRGYTRIVMGGSVVIMLLFLINGIFRGAGNAIIAMKSLWIANICNIILCPMLIRGWGPIPEFGLTGAAMATTIGRGIGVCYQLYHLFNGRHIIRLTLAHLKPEWEIIKALIDIAWPATLQFVIASGSWIVLASLVVQSGGSEASAGYQIAIRIIIFFILPAWGLSNAAATLVGQNLGAKQPDRAERSVWKTAKYNTIFMGTVSVFLITLAPVIISLFTQEDAVAKYAVMAVRIVSAGYLFYGVGMVLVSSFNGAGDTRTPTVINLFGFWFFQIPLALTLSMFFKLGALGVFIAIPVAEGAITVVSLYVFRKGKWKLKEV
jgi:putative MATE family efflux protein